MLLKDKVRWGVEYLWYAGLKRVTAREVFGVVESRFPEVTKRQTRSTLHLYSDACSDMVGERDAYYTITAPILWHRSGVRGGATFERLAPISGGGRRA